MVAWLRLFGTYSNANSPYSWAGVPLWTTWKLGALYNPSSATLPVLWPWKFLVSHTHLPICTMDLIFALQVAGRDWMWLDIQIKKHQSKPSENANKKPFGGIEIQGGVGFRSFSSSKVITVLCNWVACRVPPQPICALGAFPLEDISCSCSYLWCMEYSRCRDSALLSASRAELFSIALLPIQAALLCTHHLWWLQSRRWQPAVLGMCSRELCVQAQSAALGQRGKMRSVTFAHVWSSCKKQFCICYRVDLKAERGQ